MTHVPAAVPARSDAEYRDQLSSLQGLLALSMRMHESVDEQQILHLTTTAVPALARCHLDAVYLFSGGWQAASGPCTRPDVRADVESQFAVLSSAGGAVGILGESWGWAFPLRSVDGHFGFLVVAADDEPSPTEQFLPRTLAQQTGIALANARTNLRERQATAELQAVNVQLGETVSALRRSTEIHDRLTRVAAAGEGRDGLVQAVHELTGYPVAVEDRQGNLMAWAGPGRPERYPKDPPAVRAELLGRATHLAQPVRDGARLLAVAQPRPDVIGVLVLFDPAATAGEQEQVALEHGATVLAMEMARLASVAEAEMRLQRSVMDELLAGSNDTGVLGRAQALGYDLERAHRVVIVAPRSGSVEGTVFEAARTVVREMGYGTLLTARAGVVVVLADADCDWDQLRTAIMNELGGTPCQVAVGGVCDRPADLPRSLSQAQVALKIQDAIGRVDRGVSFDELGVYRLLAQVDDVEGVERFAKDWLGRLIDYDNRRRSDLVLTLSRYLESGGNYEAAAAELSMHRSTVKYRVQRIKEISGHDLADPDTRFNLQLATRVWYTLLAVGRHDAAAPSTAQ